MTRAGDEAPLPARIGPFLVTRVLGRGGMGIVYGGKHEDTGVEAAIKTVSEGRARLMSYVRHEASTLARIRHPGVVNILGHGVEAGRPWYAMELLTGRTLAVVLEGNDGSGASFRAATTVDGGDVPPLDDLATRPAGAWRPQLATAPTVDAPPGAVLSDPLRSGAIGSSSGVLRTTGAYDLAEILPILRGVCTALAFVHGEGVVHRDLKPDNIFIRTGDLPVLVDFGLATQVGADSRDVLQNVGGVAGSFSYMSPEQLRGELLDARCDLYALGCILYRVLTGRMPFEGTPAQITAGHLMDPALPPSVIVPSLPSVLDDLIAGLLAKDRDHRISSVEVVDAVLASIGGAPCHWPVPVPAPQPFLYRPPFVGRQDLLGPLNARLQQFLNAQPDVRPAGLVLIAGESGAGKTRLALEAVKLSAEANATAITCACAPGSSPFQPLQELFLALVEHCVVEGERETQRIFGDRAAVLALYSPAIAALPGVADLPEPEPLPSAAARTRVFQGLSETLRAFGRDRSVLVLLDDVHFADSLTLDFLAYLQGAELREPPRVLVLGTYRSEERTPALDALAQLPGTLHLTVDRMTEVEVGHMVRGMLAMADPPPAFVAFLSRESGGNPFFVAEYLRTAVAERVLVRDRRGHWQIAHHTVPTEDMCEALPLPRSLRQLVELRLGKLAAPTREVLDATAVIGRRFRRALVRRVIDIDDDALAAALDEMVAAQVVEPIEDDGYRFVHDKLHELPAAALEPERRRALHARIADAMQRLYADSLAEHDATIGRHWAAAGDPARAYPRLHAAADRARRFHSVATAVERYRAARAEVEKVLAGPDADASTRDQARDIGEKLGDALAFNGQHAPARAAFQQVLDELEPEAPVVDRARLMRKIAKTWEITHAYPEALAGYAAIEALIDASPDHAAELEPEWIQLMVGRAWICYWSNRVDDMNAVIEPLRPVIEARGSALDRYRFYLALVTRDYRRDRYRIAAETLDHMRDCVAAAREANALSEIAFARFVRGFGLLFARKLEDAEAELDTALQAARKISDAVAETRASAYLAVAHSLLGRPEAEATARATLVMARARKMADYEGVALALLGRHALAGGDREQARDFCDQAVAVWNAMTYPFPFRWIGVLPLIELGLDRTPPRELAKLARELTATAQQHLPDPIDLALKAAADAAELGDDSAVEDQLHQVVDHAHQLGYMNHDYEPRRWRHGNPRLADHAGADREGSQGPGAGPRRV